MKNILYIFFMITVLPLSVLAGSKNDQAGMELFRKHHYQDATRLLYAQLAETEPGKRPDTRRNFGMACLANAQFYDRLHLAASSIQVDYLRRIVKSDDRRGSAASRLAKLYLGKVLAASGQLAPAISILTQFLKLPQIGQNDRYEAQIALGVAYHAAGQTDRAEKVWSQVPLEDPQAAAMLAAAYQKTNVHSDKILPLVKKATEKLLSKSGPIPVQSTTALLALFSRHNIVEQGFDILARTDLENFAQEEVIGAHKVLRFYDAGLLRHLSDFYNQAALNAFNDAKKSTDARVSITATFLAGESYAFSERMDEAARAMDELLAGAPPEAISQRARVRQAAYRQGYKSRTASQKGLSAFLTPTSNASQVSDIILLCTRLGVDCPEAIQRGTMLWKESPGRPPVGLGMALGHYYRAREDHTQALRYLEAARDKSRKNRIEANPPAMLADLAWAYYKNRQFSEALEIYFNMSKQFPAVRQIQVALQGIYSMEQQSAGDAKIF